MLVKEQGEDKGKEGSDKVIYKIDVPANRLVGRRNRGGAYWGISISF